MYIHMFTYVHMYTYIYLRMCINIHVCICICIYIYMSACTYTVYRMHMYIPPLGALAPKGHDLVSTLGEIARPSPLERSWHGISVLALFLLE